MKRSGAQPETQRFRSQLGEWLAARLSPAERDWVDSALREVRRGVASTRFGSLLSLASRHVPRGPLAPTAEELQQAGACLPGWNPERWQLLDCVRVALVLARPDLCRENGQAAIEEAFRYADAGELGALYRSLGLLPRPECFVWRAGEGCRSNMRSVFESIACDNPFPVRWFGDDAWLQLIIKCVFVGAPLWRVYGLDSRLSPDLARMALDLVEERRSAGRPVPPALWLCIGEYAGERGVAALERELVATAEKGRQAAVLALARAGERQRLEALASGGSDPALRRVLAQALDGRFDQSAFAPFD